MTSSQIQMWSAQPAAKFACIGVMHRAGRIVDTGAEVAQAYPSRYRMIATLPEPGGSASEAAGMVGLPWDRRTDTATTGFSAA